MDVLEGSCMVAYGMALPSKDVPRIHVQLSWTKPYMGYTLPILLY